MRFALIAYAHADQTLADALTEDLRQRGIDVWLADDTKLNDRKHMLTVDALNRCRAHILIESPASAASDWVQATLKSAHLQRQVTLKIKAETIQDNLDGWLDSQDKGINLLPREFYDQLAKAGLIHRRRGGLLKSQVYPSATYEAKIYSGALLLVGLFLLLNILTVARSDRSVDMGGPQTDCDGTVLPRVAMLEQTTTNEFTGITNATISFRGMASDRPVIRLLKSSTLLSQPNDNFVLDQKQADFGDIVFTVTDFDYLTTLKVEVTCHGFCYYWLRVKEIGCNE